MNVKVFSFHIDSATLNDHDYSILYDLQLADANHLLKKGIAFKCYSKKFDFVLLTVAIHPVDSLFLRSDDSSRPSNDSIEWQAANKWSSCPNFGRRKVASNDL